MRRRERLQERVRTLSVATQESQEDAGLLLVEAQEALAKCEETLHLLQNPRELKRHLREQRKDAKVHVLPREIGTGLVNVAGEGQQPGPMLL